MANARGKEMDNTHLSIDHALRRGFIHRDYIAHCLRWSHVSRWLREGRRYSTYHVIDVGCGRDLPLPRMLYSDRMTHTTGSYTGVDINPLERPEGMPETGKFRMALLGRTNFLEAALPRGTYDLAVCFEALEHVEPLVAYRILRRIKLLLGEYGTAFVSTPCYDPRVGAANNHVNEMTVAGFGALIYAAGLKTSAVWGTFASQRDYKHLLRDRGLQEIYEELAAYYDSNVLACILAPLFPDNSRNRLWRLVPGTCVELPAEVGEPINSSSARWARDIAQIREEMAP